MAKNWNELVKKKYAKAPERLARIERAVAAELLEMDLREVRELLGLTQVEAAVKVGWTQGELSRAERREDHKMSTLRRFVEGLGGELEVTARFGDRSVRLRGV
jgi:hypothetical protein